MSLKVKNIGHFVYPILFFLIFSLFIGFKIVFKNEVIFTGDNFDLLLPQKYFWKQEVLQGKVPLWNPYILSGTPYLADINLGTFSPVNIFYLIIPSVARAASILIIIEFFLIGFFTYLLAKYYKVSEVGSAVSGVSFMASGIVLIYLTNLAIFNAVTCLPMVIFFLEKSLLKSSYRLLILTSIIFCFQILSGHAQITFYTSLLVLFLILFHRQYGLFSRLKIIGVIFLLSFGLSAIQLLPFFEFIKHTPRAGQSYQWVTAGSLNFTDFWKFIFPKFAYNFTGWVDFSAKVNLGYFGVIPFILFLIGCFSHNRVFRFFKWVALISLILALGNNTPVYRIVYLLPGFSSLRVPSQIIVLYTFAASLIAGAGIDLLIKTITVQKKYYLPLILLIVTFLILFITSFSFLKDINLATSINPTSYKISVYIVNLIWLIELMVVFSMGLCLLKLGKKFLTVTIIFTFLLLDLFLSSQAVLLTAPEKNLKSNNNHFQKPYQYRTYTVPPEQKPDSPVFSPEIEVKFAREKKELLLPNQNIYQGIYSLDGYASMAIANYLNQFTNASETITGLGKLDIKTVDFAKSGVKYLIGKQTLYEVKNSRPRFFLNGRGTVEFKKENSQELELDINNEEATKLILLDTFYPGWNAYIYNRKVNIELYEGVYRTISIPEGQFPVKFIFAPQSYVLGKILSGFFSILVVFLVIKPRKIT